MTEPRRNGHDDSTQPANVVLEQHFLGAAMIANKTLSTVGFLHPEHFYLPVHGRIYAAMRQMVDRGEPANPVTLKTIFEHDGDLTGPGGAAGYLTQLAQSAVTTRNQPDYARRIADLAQRRELIALADDIRQRAADPSDDIVKRAAHLAEALHRIAEGGQSNTRALIKTGDVGRLKKIDWLWPGWLAAGKFHILGGMKGTGKSTIVFDLFAQITVGGKFPDGSPAPLGDVAIWSGEDDIDDTILPRIYAAGGDLSHVHFPEETIVDGKRRAFDPAFDIPPLIEAARKIPALRAVLIDPVVSASTADSHKNSETRRGLQPLIDMAEELNLLLIGITHFTKGTQGQEPIERITGSLAFGAIPRIVMGAAKGEDEDAPRKLVRIASNIGKSGGGFEYLLHQELLPDLDFTGQRVIWGKPLTGSAVDLLGDGKAASQKLEAIKFLDDQLAGGAQVKVKELKDAATAFSIAWRTVERAKAEIGNIVSEKVDTAYAWRKNVGGPGEP